jgi:xanthine dehydrogenase accessory factor
MGQDVLDALARARQAESTVVLGTTVRIEGDPPSAPGNRALFAEDGRLLAGTIGCNGLDRRAGTDARELLGAGKRTGMSAYTSFEGEPGEGVVEVFLEAFGGRPRLLVGSGGPVADMLTTLGEHLGLAVRTEPAIASPAFAEALGMLGPRDAVVFVDHDAPGLLPAIQQALAGEAGYVGVMGSRRHTPGFVAELRATGADLRRLHSPTGLDIGARVPGEIALSILAEVLAALRGRDGGSLDIVRTSTGTGPGTAGTG